MVTKADLSIDAMAFCPWAQADIVYTSRRLGGDVSVNLPRCSFILGQVAEGAPTNAAYIQSDSRADFGYADVAGFFPKPGDHMIVNGDFLVVMNVYPRDFHKLWSVTVRDFGIAYDLRQFVDVYAPAPTPDSYSLRVPNHALVYGSMACSLQPEIREQTYQAGGGEKTRRTCTLYFADPVALMAGYKAVVDGVIYEIDSQNAIDQLGVLNSASCHRID